MADFSKFKEALTGTDLLSETDRVEAKRQMKANSRDAHSELWLLKELAFHRAMATELEDFHHRTTGAKRPPDVAIMKHMERITAAQEFISAMDAWIELPCLFVGQVRLKRATIKRGRTGIGGREMNREWLEHVAKWTAKLDAEETALTVKA